MDKVIVSAIVAAFVQTSAVFAGEPVTSNKEVVPPAAPPPTSFFRANEFDVGAFAHLFKGFGDNFGSVGEHGWAAAENLSYFPWLYAGFRLQGSVMNTIPGDNTAGDVKADVVLRYPLDLIAPNFHLAPTRLAVWVECSQVQTVLGISSPIVSGSKTGETKTITCLETPAPVWNTGLPRT